MALGLIDSGGVRRTEGVTTCKAVVQLASARGVDMPICQEIHAVLFEGKPPLEAVKDLMTRQQKDEVVV